MSQEFHLCLIVLRRFAIYSTNVDVCAPSVSAALPISRISGLSGNAATLPVIK